MGILDKLASKLTDAATTLGTAAAPRDPGLTIDQSERTQTLTQDLSDLRLPKDLLSWMGPLLTDMGFTIEHPEVKVFDTTVSQYSVVKNAFGQRALFHIPKQTLDDIEGLKAVNNILFQSDLTDQSLLILSKGVNAAHVSYAWEAKTRWPERLKIKASIIPWRHLEETRMMGTEIQKSFLKILLNLDGLFFSVSQISDAELLNLSNIFAGLAQFIDDPPEGWRTFLFGAGLSPLVGELNLSGKPPGDTAFSVLRSIKVRQRFPPDSKDEVLGLVLCHALASIGDLPTANRTFIKGVLKKYNLAPSRSSEYQ